MELSSFKNKRLTTFQEMELYISKIKKFLYFQKWNFLISYFSYISGQNFRSSKNKKTHSEKSSNIFSKKLFLYFRKQNFFIFSQKKAFLIYFHKWSFLATSLKISGWNFLRTKIKKNPL